MKVSELIEELQKYSGDCVVRLSVNGHVYDSEDDADSHGPLYVLSDDRSRGQRRVLICEDHDNRYAWHRSSA